MPISDTPSLKTGRYRHYKGAEYEVLDLARHSETEEWLVVYRQCYGDFSLWVRPLSLFQEPVVKEDGSELERFAWIGN
ncbi:DUF1653 domain-containing protein [Neptuniibacter sp. CAU 1671]|uniref:DUF1653 domain-containing protein n=1 Tax=Neptuniibacter sp. CAU 1671 TaxID=3032593 RepID=UPI0023DC7B5D|nr:DUF1653 domain-containing protein [Neptuniibacter sp. CAU 1671]MDF2182917.1 DUF1653 domain-containing protein [Neptuniibacter sp. CAU 1671]